MELTNSNSQHVSLKGDKNPKFLIEGTPISRDRRLAWALFISTRDGAFRSCMKKFDEARMAVDMILSNR